MSVRVAAGSICTTAPAGGVVAAGCFLETAAVVVPANGAEIARLPKSKAGSRPAAGIRNLDRR
jgi:hypothetical protein